MSVMFHKRHYQPIGKILREALRGVSDYDKYEALCVVVDHFVDLFKEDNPAFNEAKFRKLVDPGYVEERSQGDDGQGRTEY